MPGLSPMKSVRRLGEIESVRRLLIEAYLLGGA